MSRRLSYSRPGAVAVALVGRDAVRLRAGPARTDPRNADLCRHRLELGAICPLPRGDDQGQRGIGRVLVSPHDGGVDRDVSVDLGLGLGLLQQTFPRAVG